MITTCPSPRNHRSTQRQHAAVNAIRTTAVPAHTKKTSLYAPNCITLHIISQLLYRCSVQRNRFEERSPRVRNILISLPLIDLIQSHVQCSWSNCDLISPKAALKSYTALLSIHVLYTFWHSSSLTPHTHSATHKHSLTLSYTRWHTLPTTNLRWRTHLIRGSRAEQIPCPSGWHGPPQNLLWVRPHQVTVGPFVRYLLHALKHLQCSLHGRHRSFIVMFGLRGDDFLFNVPPCQFINTETSTLIPESDPRSSRLEKVLRAHRKLFRRRAVGTQD